MSRSSRSSCISKPSKIRPVTRLFREDIWSGFKAQKRRCRPAALCEDLPSFSRNPNQTARKYQIGRLGFSPSHDFVAASATRIAKFLYQLRGKYPPKFCPRRDCNSKQKGGIRNFGADLPFGWRPFPSAKLSRAGRFHYSNHLLSPIPMSASAPWAHVLWENVDTHYCLFL